MLSFNHGKAATGIRPEPKRCHNCMQAQGVKVLRRTQTIRWWGTYHQRRKQLLTAKAEYLQGSHPLSLYSNLLLFMPLAGPCLYSSLLLCVPLACTCLYSSLLLSVPLACLFLYSSLLLCMPLPGPYLYSSLRLCMPLARLCLYSSLLPCCPWLVSACTAADSCSAPGSSVPDSSLQLFAPLARPCLYSSLLLFVPLARPCLYSSLLLFVPLAPVDRRANLLSSAGLQCMGLYSSAGRALQCEHRGHGFESR